MSALRTHATRSIQGARVDCRNVCKLLLWIQITYLRKETTLLFSCPVCDINLQIIVVISLIRIEWGSEFVMACLITFGHNFVPCDSYRRGERFILMFLVGNLLTTFKHAIRTSSTASTLSINHVAGYELPTFMFLHTALIVDIMGIGRCVCAPHVQN